MQPIPFNFLGSKGKIIGIWSSNYRNNNAFCLLVKLAYEDLEDGYENESVQISINLSHDINGFVTDKLPSNTFFAKEYDGLDTFVKALVDNGYIKPCPEIPVATSGYCTYNAYCMTDKGLLTLAE